MNKWIWVIGVVATLGLTGIGNAGSNVKVTILVQTERAFPAARPADAGDKAFLVGYRDIEKWQRFHRRHTVGADSLFGAGIK